MALTLPVVSQSLVDAIKLYSGFIVQTNHVINTKDSEVSWHGYARGIHKLAYQSEYQILLDGRQYSALFKDDSFCQFFYKFSSAGVLTSARLAYYPAPQRSVEKAIEAAFDEGNEELLADLEEALPPSRTDTHMRVDFDGSATSHDKLHLQFSSYNNLRIPANRIVLPVPFLDFIFRNDDQLTPYYSGLVNRAGYQAALGSAIAHSAPIALTCGSYYLTHA